MEPRVDLVGVLRLVDIAPVVNDRCAPHAQSAVSDAPAQVRGLNGIDIAHRTGGDVIAVIVIPADLLIQLQKLLLGDGAQVQGLQPVLDAGVVKWPTSEPCRGVASKNIHQVIVEIAPYASRIGRRIILNALRNDGVARTALRLGADRISGPDRRQGGYCRIAGGGFYLRVPPSLCRARIEVMQEQVSIGDVVDHRGNDLWERASDQNAIHEAGIFVADRLRRFRAARAPIADGERYGPAVLDEALSPHHQTLGRQQILAIVAVDVEGRSRQTVTLAEHQVFEYPAVSEACALDITPADAAAAQGVDEAVVPCSGRVERRRRRLGGWIVQHRGFVNGAVDRPGFDAYDVRYGLALGRRGLS